MLNSPAMPLANLNDADAVELGDWKLPIHDSGGVL
jgi:hypothetical protein